MKISLNVLGNSSDENKFPHKLLLTNTQVSKLWSAFTNVSSANIKQSKTQLHEIGKSDGFLGLWELLPKTGLPLIWNVLKPIPKSTLIPLRLTAAASAMDEAKEIIWTWFHDINNFSWLMLWCQI